MNRDRKFTMNCSKEELEMLREVAESVGLTASDWIRLQVRLAYTNTFGEPKRKDGKR